MNPAVLAASPTATSTAAVISKPSAGHRASIFHTAGSLNSSVNLQNLTVLADY